MFQRHGKKSTGAAAVMSSASDAQAPILLCGNPGETKHQDRTCLSGHTTWQTINRPIWIVTRTMSRWLLFSYWVLYWACDCLWPAFTKMIRQLLIGWIFQTCRVDVLSRGKRTTGKKLVVLQLSCISLAIYRCSRLGCNSDKGDCGVCYLLFQVTQARWLTAQQLLLLLSPPLEKRC